MKSVAGAARALLMLDYDGTIAPFCKQRHQAFPYPEIQTLLQEISRDPRTRLVIVSGRTASEIPPLLGLRPCPELWGLHGLERRLADGTTQTRHLRPGTLDALSDAQRWLGYQQLLDHAEIKTGSIAVHWRGLRESQAEHVRSRVLLGWRPISEHSGLRLLDFDGGVEIRPSETNKGDVVRMLLQEAGPCTPAAYLGDDVTDEPAFQAISGRGLSLLVRDQPRPTAAQAWIRPPHEVQEFLRQWLQASRLPHTGETMAAGG